MSFPVFLDENVNVLLASLLNQAGFDAMTTVASGRANTGASDEEQLEFATSLGRALLTHNVRDFAPMAQVWASSGRNHAGIILCEIRSPRDLYQRMLRLQAMYHEWLS